MNWRISSRRASVSLLNEKSIIEAPLHFLFSHGETRIINGAPRTRDPSISKTAEPGQNLFGLGDYFIHQLTGPFDFMNEGGRLPCPTGADVNFAMEPGSLIDVFTDIF